MSNSKKISKSKTIKRKSNRITFENDKHFDFSQTSSFAIVVIFIDFRHLLENWNSKLSILFHDDCRCAFVSFVFHWRCFVYTSKIYRFFFAFFRSRWTQIFHKSIVFSSFFAILKTDSNFMHFLFFFRFSWACLARIFYTIIVFSLSRRIAFSTKFSSIFCVFFASFDYIAHTFCTYLSFFFRIFESMFTSTIVWIHRFFFLVFQTHSTHKFHLFKIFFWSFSQICHSIIHAFVAFLSSFRILILINILKFSHFFFVFSNYIFHTIMSCVYRFFIVFSNYTFRTSFKIHRFFILKCFIYIAFEYFSRIQFEFFLFFFSDFLMIFHADIRHVYRVFIAFVHYFSQKYFTHLSCFFHFFASFVTQISHNFIVFDSSFLILTSYRDIESLLHSFWRLWIHLFVIKMNSEILVERNESKHNNKIT